MGKSSFKPTLNVKKYSRMNIAIAAVAVIIVAIVGYAILSSSAAAKTADLNSDGIVNILDMSALLSKWGQTGTLTADINADNVVNVFDLSVILSQWGTAGNPPSSSSVGAQLPISYDITTLTGTVRYVATNGNDTTGTGTINAPYATLSKAISSSASNDTIVVRGGTYRGAGAMTIGSSKTLRIIAYPGEIPIFNGARQVNTGWVDEGSFKYVAYTPRPVTDGVISVTTGQNLTGDGVGKYADQAWVGASEQREVTQKTSLVDGKFWVDRVNNRLYMTAADVNKGSVEITQMGRFIHIQSPNTKLEGIRITRYSNNAGEYGVVLIATTADNNLIKNVEIIDSAYADMFVDGSSNRNDGTKVTNSTLTGANWSGIGLNGTDNFTLEYSRLTNMNAFDEFSHSPASGAIKTARTWYTKIIGNEFSDNHSHTVWFDISNYQTIIANNKIVDNWGTGVFYEISDDLLLINNYIKSSRTTAQPVKLAGSSGIKMINNTIIGGRDPIGVYTDDRSMPGCADPANPACGPWGHLRDSYHPYLDTMDWIPRIDLMINNVVGYATGSSFCGGTPALCFTQRNTDAYVPIEWTIHPANYNGTGRPQTLINGNVYANGTAKIIAINEPSGSYTTTSAFATAMAGAPVSISGFETMGLYGNSYINPDGTPTAALDAVHNNAYPVPTDNVINQFVPAGNKHYGVTYDIN